MNRSFFVVNFQKEAVELLVYLKKNCSAFAIKADFEAEGTGFEELVFLSYVVAKAGLGLTLKIGGCEAVFDLKQAKLFGAQSVMVPVVESEFALKKFYSAASRVFGSSNFNSPKLILNVETKTCVENLEQILRIGSKFLNSVVVGRVDLSSSLNLSRGDIDSDLVFEQCKKVVGEAKKFGLLVGLGGGVSSPTHDRFLKKLEFNFFETRKVVFKNECAGKAEFNNWIRKATEFEVLCLKFKCEFFKQLAGEDELRLKLLEQRLSELN